MSDAKIQLRQLIKKYKNQITKNNLNTKYKALNSKWRILKSGSGW